MACLVLPNLQEKLQSTSVYARVTLHCRIIEGFRCIVASNNLDNSAWFSFAAIDMQTKDVLDTHVIKEIVHANLVQNKAFYDVQPINFNRKRGAKKQSEDISRYHDDSNSSKQTIFHSLFALGLDNYCTLDCQVCSDKSNDEFLYIDLQIYCKNDIVNEFHDDNVQDHTSISMEQEPTPTPLQNANTDIAITSDSLPASFASSANSSHHTNLTSVDIVSDTQSKPLVLRFKKTNFTRPSFVRSSTNDAQIDDDVNMLRSAEIILNHRYTESNEIEYCVQWKNDTEVTTEWCNYMLLLHDSKLIMNYWRNAALSEQNSNCSGISAATLKRANSVQNDLSRRSKTTNNTTSARRHMPLLRTWKHKFAFLQILRATSQPYAIESEEKQKATSLLPPVRKSECSVFDLFGYAGPYYFDFNLKQNSLHPHSLHSGVGSNSALSNSKWNNIDLNELYESIKPAADMCASSVNQKVPGMITTLLPFQARAVSWMQRRECTAAHSLLLDPTWEMYSVSKIPTNAINEKHVNACITTSVFCESSSASSTTKQESADCPSNSRSSRIWYNTFTGSVSTREPWNMTDINGGILAEESKYSLLFQMFRFCFHGIYFCMRICT
jgi:hypothetical protein